MRDPIYLDLLKMASAFENEANQQQAKAEKAESDYNKAEIRSIERKTFKRELEKAQDAHQKALQMAEYYKIKARLREAEAKVSYKRAFLEGKDWPDPKEYESYALQKKMRSISRHWGDRLPKTGQEIVKVPGEEAGSGGSEH